MPKNYDVLVVAGQSGSKSTFIGGLYQRGYQVENIGLSYTPIEGNVREDFINGVIKPMTSRNVYPDQTEQGYVVKLTLDGGGTAIPDINFKFVDIPGEQISQVLPEVQADIADGGIDESGLKKEFEKVRSNIGGDQQITKDDWVTIFKYYYSQASMVMFLFNIHKIMIQNEDLSVTSDWLESAADDKVKTAVVLTAVDLLDYDSDDPTYESKLTLKNRMFDKGLKQHIEDRMQLGTAPGLMNTLQSAANNDQIDLFSVSVPAAKPGDTSDNRLKPSDDGGFETKGFNEVISWLKE